MTDKIFPKTIKAKDILKKSYFQRGRYHFLIYNLDGSISKACSGLYLPPINFLNKLDFFVYKNKKWINIHNHLKKVKIESFETIHFYEIDDIKIRLEIFLPDNFTALRFFIKANKKIKLKFKPIIEFDYIYKYHANPVRGHVFKKFKNDVILHAKFDNKTVLMFNSDAKLNINNTKLKINYLEINMKSCNINILCSEKSEIELYHMLKEIKTDTRLNKKNRYEKNIFEKVILKTDNKELNENFEFAKYNLFLLRHRQTGIGRGYLAGVPYFLSFFGRDTFWSIPGALMLGDFENIKDCLNMFAKYQSEVNTETKKPGKISHEIWLNGEINYYSTDSSMLFVHSLYWYYQHTKDKKYLEDIFPTFKETIDFLIKNLERNKINHGKLGFLKDTTWMDSYNRGQTAIEMQALLASCFNVAIEIAKIVKDKDAVKEWGIEKNKSEKVLKKFRKNGFWIDHLNKDKTQSKSITANPLFLLVLNLISKKQAKEIVKFLEKSELFTDFGVRSRAKKSKAYNPASYHKGGIWSFLSGIYLIGMYNYNLKDNTNILNSFSKHYRNFSYGLAPEYIHGDNFDLHDLKHDSCFLFLWSSALYIQAVLQGMCGIKINKKGKLYLNPQLPKDVTKVEVKNFRFGKNFYDIEINGKKGKIKKVLRKN